MKEKNRFKVRAYIKLMRVPHYIKNLLLFVPALTSGKLFLAGNYGNYIYMILGFFAFCFASSAIYVLNDIYDADKDRLNAAKMNRPIASGAVSVKNAYVFCAALFAVSVLLLVPLVFKTRDYIPAVLLGIYIALNFLYSKAGLKNMPLIDIAILSAGYLIRVYFGAQIIDVSVSGWLYLCVLSFSLFMGFGKRRGETLKNNAVKRSVLKYYSPSFLEKNTYLYMALSIVFYSLWCMNSIYKSLTLYLTIPVVMLLCSRYSMLLEGTSDGDPVTVVLSDKPLAVMIIIYIVLILCCFLGPV